MNNFIKCINCCDKNYYCNNCFNILNNEYENNVKLNIKLQYNNQKLIDNIKFLKYKNNLYIRNHQNNINQLNEKYKNDIYKIKLKNDIFNKKKLNFLKKLDIKLSNNQYLKNIFNETTTPSNIDWEIIDYILRRTENFSQEELDKMSETQKMQLV